MKKQLLSLILMVLATALPTMLWAQTTAGDEASDEVLPPTFHFNGDSLIIETATENASIFYQIADLPNMDEATIEKISSSMTVTADVQQSIYYHQPIEITKSVIVKAIAAGATISEVSTLIYDYDAWQKLLEATDYAMDVSGRASDNANVPGELKEQLSNMVEEAKWAYYERMWESQAVTSFTSELMQLAHQIDEMMATVAEPEPYAVLSYSESSFAQMWGIDYTKTLTFYFDDQKESRGGMSIIPFSSYESVPWVGDRDSITTVVFDSSFAEYKDLTSTAYWFDGCQFLSEVLGIGNLHTDNVTDMNNMFNYCYSLKSLDVSGFNTANVTTMNGMFSSCFSLTALNVSGFNTANVTDMSRMFSSCSSLTALNVNGFNTSNVTDMSNMFSGCSALVSIDVSNFNTSNVTDMSSMFSDCTSLTSLDLSSFNTANVTDMGNFFYRCSNLSELNVLGFNSENVTNMERMFWECSNLTTLDVSSFNTSIVLSFSRMFSECPNLTTIYAGDGWTTESIKTSTNMFTGSTSLVGGKGTTYDANHVDYTYARIDGGPSNPGYFTDKNAPAVDDLELYAIEAESDMKSNEILMPTSSIMMTLGNDSVWVTRTDLAPELGGELQFDAGIYYPSRYTRQHAFVNCVVGTKNPADGPLVEGSSTGYSYKPRWRNLPQSGAYFIFESLKDGSLIVPIRLNPEKPLYVTDENGKPLTSYQLKNPDGSTIALDANSSTAEKTIAFISMNVNKNQKYYIFCKGSKPRVGGYIFAPYPIDIDPITTAAALDSLQAEPVDATFDSNGVLAVGGTTTMTDALESVGGRDEVAKTITAIVWNSSATLTNSDLQGLDNPNMLIYVNSSEQAPDRDNVVVGDFAKNIVLKDVESGNNNFYCPQAFTAEMMSYTRDFQQQTEIGVSRGWETIALPFTVQTIMHEKNGVIAPFGNDASGKHFWLRQLTQEGVARATAIQANTPYVISMPNNNEYPGEFNLAGRVTFSSQNVTVPVTTDYANSMLDANTNTMIVFYPAMHRVTQSEETYALNVSSAQAGYAEGSVFVAGLRDVRPFEAYTWHHAHGPAPRYIPISELNGGMTAIESLTPSLSEGEGAWYDLKGRRLLQKPVLKGVYLHNGRKVVMK